jgi:hypothetical protein
MRRVVLRIMAVITLVGASGCGAPGVYRSAGHLPGIAYTDYAFSFYCGTAFQLFQFAPLQVETSMMEALGDLGFKVPEPPMRQKDGEIVIRALAPDGRPTLITISPQNALSSVEVTIGPDHLGDYELSRDLLRHVALNFGTGIRAYTPVETTLPRRLNVSRGIPPRTRPDPPESIDDEALRPEEKRTATTEEEQAAAPGSEAGPTAVVPGTLRGFIPTRDYPNPPNMPYAPWPYSPYNYDQFPY